MSAAQRIAEIRARFGGIAAETMDRCWAGVRELAAPARFPLDAAREPGGQWADFFAHTPWRPLDLPALLLHDLGLADTPERRALEDRLFLASALTATAILIDEAVLFGEAHFGYADTLVTRGLLAEAEGLWSEGATDPAALRADSVRHWARHGAAMLALRRWVGRVAPWGPADLAEQGERWAPLFTGVWAAARWAGRAEIMTEIGPWLDEAATLFQAARDLQDIHRDLARGHCTAPIAAMLRAIGGLKEGPLDTDKAWLGGLLTRALPDFAAGLAARAEALEATIRERGYEGLATAVAGLRAPFAAIADAPMAPAALPPYAPFILDHRPHWEQVMRGAAGFLRADPEYREAWEINRWRFLGAPELICRVFPTAIVIDNRIAAGEACAADVDALVTRYAANRYHYFEQPSLLPPDTDTLGVMLRLARHAGDPTHARASLEEPLGWLVRELGEDGSIPVFLSPEGTGGSSDPAGRYIRTLGRSCAAVGARLLLGLLEFDGERFRGAIERCAAALLRDFTRDGAGAFWHYEAPPGCWLILELVAALRAAGFGALAAAASAAEARALGLLEAQRGAARHSPQDAALLWMAGSLGGAAAQLRDPDLVAHLLRSQRQDGGWDACPFYTLPTRGNLMSWYRSRLVTTSFAYRALAGAQAIGRSS